MILALFPEQVPTDLVGRVAPCNSELTGSYHPALAKSLRRFSRRRQRSEEVSKLEELVPSSKLEELVLSSKPEELVLSSSQGDQPKLALSP